MTTTIYIIKTRNILFPNDYNEYLHNKNTKNLIKTYKKQNNEKQNCSALINAIG